MAAKRQKALHVIIAPCDGQMWWLSATACKLEGVGATGGVMTCPDRAPGALARHFHGQLIPGTVCS